MRAIVEQNSLYLDIILSLRSVPKPCNFGDEPLMRSLATKFEKPRFHLSYMETRIFIDANLNFIHLGVSKTLVGVEFPKPRFRRQICISN